MANLDTDTTATEQAVALEHGTAKQWFLSSEDLSQDQRTTAEQSRDYYDNIQWTQAELEELRKRKQPPVTKNRIKPKVDFLLGMERQMRTDPRAYARNPEDIEGAQAATDSIRYVCDANVFDQVRSDVAENLFIEGTGGVECTVEAMPSGEKKILVSHIPWDRIWIDPHSRRRDCQDAKFFGWVLWMDMDDALEMWPDSADLFETLLSSSATDETYEDAPRNRWADSTRRRVRVVGVWFHSKGDWNRGIFTGSGWVEDPEKSPWLDSDGVTEPGMIIQSAFITRENERYGIVYPLLSIQDAINFRSSKSVHLLSQRQTWGTKDTGLVTADIKREMAKPDGHVELPAGKKLGENFGIIPTTDMAQGNFNLLQEDKAEIDNLGAAAALSGKGGASSGRELIARQQGGKMELGPVFDGLRQWQHRVYRWIWARAQQFWTEEKIIRVTDDEKNTKFVKLNEPMTVRKQLEEQGVEIPPHMQNDPRLDVEFVRNNVAELDVDIVVDDAPDTTTLVGEQFEQLVSLYQASPQDIPFRLIIEAGNFRNKDQLLEILDKKEQQENQGGQNQQQIAQALQQLAMQGEAAKLQKTQVETVKTQAEIENVVADTRKKETEAAENISDIEANRALARENRAEAFRDEVAGQKASNILQVFGF